MPTRNITMALVGIANMFGPNQDEISGNHLVRELTLIISDHPIYLLILPEITVGSIIALFPIWMMGWKPDASPAALVGFGNLEKW